MPVLSGAADVAIVIPARYASTRFPAKPLAMLRGAGGVAKPLIERSHGAACAVMGREAVHIATDDARIAQAAARFGGRAIMTPENCANGTERVAAALNDLPEAAGIIINFQGDALLTPPDLVAALIEHMRAHPDCGVATVGVRCSPGAYRHLVADQMAGRVGGTTVVVNARDEALYFSKRVLPHIPPGDALEKAPPVLLHLGLYAYRRAALQHYAALPPCDLERIEGLEQLRFLVHDVPVTVLRAEPPAWDAIELNNPSDVGPIEAILTARGVE